MASVFNSNFGLNSGVNGTSAYSGTGFNNNNGFNLADLLNSFGLGDINWGDIDWSDFTLGNNNLQNINWNDIDWVDFLSSTNLGSLFQGTELDTVLDNIDLDEVFQFLGDNSFLSDIVFGDLLDGLGGDLFADFDLGDIFGSIDDLDLGGFSVGDLVDDLGSLFADLDLGELFGGLDDDSLYIFDSLSTTDLFKSISQLDLANSMINGTIDPQKVDILDGFGEILNVLGASDLLNGINVSQLVRGSLGDEALLGELVGDCLLGLAGNDRLLGYFGNDLLNGGVGNDLIKGLLGNDVMAGMDGNDRILADKGNDILFGGAGLDTLVTGRGRDLCVVGEGLGQELIRDFRDGLDRIGLLGDIDFNDLDITQSGRNALVSHGKEALALLKGVNGDRLSASDFVSLG